MTSTPPAWKWRDECEVPVTSYTLADLLSMHSHKPPESDALCERNGSGTEPGMSSFTTRKLEPDPTGEDIWPLERAVSTNAIGTCCAPERDCAAQVTDSVINAAPEHVGPAPDKATAQNYNEHINAVPEHPTWVCAECGQAASHGKRVEVSTWQWGQCGTCGMTKAVTEPRDFGGYHKWSAANRYEGDPLVKVTAPETTAPADSCVVESCPECGTVTDIEYAELMAEGYREMAEDSHAAPQCPVCRHETENDEGVLCDICGEPTGPGSFAVVNGPGGVFVYHLPCYDKAQWGEEDAEDVEEAFDVPFPVQSWMFEALIELEVDHLHEIIDDHRDEIVKMARRRHRTGHVLHGSKGYQWDAKTRLRNVLEELADAPTYLTMGSIE